MYKVKNLLLLISVIALFTFAQNAMATPITYSVQTTNTAPPLAGIIYLDLIDGDGLTGSSVRLTNLSMQPTAIDGSVSPIPSGFLLSDDSFISTLAFETANVYSGFSFTLDANWANSVGIGFPDALVLSFTDANGAPLFPTNDPRGLDAFLVMSSSGIENYVPNPFSLSIGEAGSQPIPDAVPEPNSIALFVLGAGLLFITFNKQKKHLALYSILFISVGSASAALNDVTSQVAVDRAPLVYNRTAKTFSGLVTIRNTSTSPLSSPIYLVVSNLPTSVKITGALDLSPDQYPMLKLPVEQNGLAPGDTISNFKITFVNPNNLKFTPILKVLTFEGGLPPDPGAAGKKTLAGIDANGNGIRDDVEIYIRVNFGKSEKEVQALNQMAISTQMGILAKTNAESMKSAIADQRSMECIFYATPGSQAWKLVEAISLNTPERIDAWQDHERRLSGHTFKSSNDEKTSCTFDPDLLKN